MTIAGGFADEEEDTMVAQYMRRRPRRCITVRMNAETKVALDTVWVVITACLVFFMNAGFAMFESGLCRSKNAVNILAKNVVVFGIASLAFWLAGFALMFGDGNAIIGLSGWMLHGADNSPVTGAGYHGVYTALAAAGVPLDAKFFFQLVFAGTAATIVSGAVAERIKFSAFLIFSFVLVALVYPLAGHWVRGGWLAGLGFVDFAGATVVHSVGGWAALSGVILLGPRLGKYLPNGDARPVPAHNMTAATLGAFILWLGWFGFNAGSTMAVEPDAIARIALNTAMAGAAACVSATVVAWLLLTKPDLSLILSGTLTGLVAVTGACDAVSVSGAVIIGLLAGPLTIYAVLFFDKIKIDDPVGAISVHLVGGIFGTLSVGLFASEGGLFWGGGFARTATQAVGVAAVGAATFTLTLLVWWILRATLGIRVSPAEELEGLDTGEHGIEAYAAFVKVSEE
jgi:Amt family ammonium transporter